VLDTNPTLLYYTGIDRYVLEAELVILGEEDLKKDGPTPIYSQLETLMRDKIETGQLSVGERAPSDRELATSLSISRMTARAAISKLVSDGYLHAVPGKGTFVSDPKLRQDLLELTSFTEDMRRRGLTPGARLLGVEVEARVPAKVGIALRLAPGDQVVRVSRLRTADGCPMCVETSYLPRAMVPWLPEEDLGTGSLYRLLEDRGIWLSKAEEDLEATLVTEEESALLTVPAGSPALLVERISYTDGDDPVEYVKSLYRGDRYRFSARLFRKRAKWGGGRS